MSTDEHENQLKDMMDLGSKSLKLEDIEMIAEKKSVRKRWEKKLKNRLYSMILLSLTHEHFGDFEAKMLWKKIVIHMDSLNMILGRNVGISVACMDYLSNIRGTLEDPKIIEEDKSEFVAGSTTKDELTGLYIRDVFNVMLSKEIKKSGRNSTHLSLLMIDIDDFKNVNDKYGHLKGDKVLAKIGSVLNETVRGMDIAARYGGEEFAVIMPETDSDQAFEVAERIRKEISKIKFEKFSVTVSIGISQTSSLIKSPTELILAADIGLYNAKESGKNCTRISKNK